MEKTGIQGHRTHTVYCRYLLDQGLGVDCAAPFLLFLSKQDGKPIKWICNEEMDLLYLHIVA